MLVLTRKLNQTIIIGDDIVVKVLGIGATQIKIGIECPEDVKVLRAELLRDGQDWKRDGWREGGNR